MDDGIEYTKEQFLAHYGGTEEWDVALKAQQAVENERPPPRVSVRMDDGIEYTKEQFLAHYGGTEEWDAASRRMMESGAAAADGNDAGADVPDWDALRSTSVPIGRPIGKFDKYRECESRRVFFRNRDTGATSWDAPVAPDAAPDVGITAAVVGIATEAPSAPPSALLSGPLPPMVAAASSVKDDGGVCLFLLVCIFMTEYCQPYSTNIILLIPIPEDAPPEWDSLRSTSVPTGRPIGPWTKYRECDSRRIFFRNRDTGATSWDAPDEFTSSTTTNK